MFVIQHLHCRRVRRLLWDHLAERLSEGPLELVERHLSNCPRCRREAAGLRQAQAILEACRREPMPSPRTQWHTLRARLQDGPLPPTSPRRPAWQARLAATGGFAAALLAVAVTVRLSLPVSTLPTTQVARGVKPSAPVTDRLVKPGTDSPLTARPPEHVQRAPDRAEGTADNATPTFVRLTDLWPALISNYAGSEAPVSSQHLVRNAEKARVQVRQQQAHRPTSNPRLAQYDGNQSHFRHYNPRPEDRLPEHAPGQDANDLDLRQVSNDGGYVIEPLRPDDDEHPY